MNDDLIIKDIFYELCDDISVRNIYHNGQRYFGTTDFLYHIKIIDNKAYACDKNSKELKELVGWSIDSINIYIRNGEWYEE